MLTDNELAFLIDWVTLRKSETGNNINISLLFTSNNSTNKYGLDQLLTISSTYDVIHRVMRKVTGDDDIIFHCLRHSFVSWHLLFQEAERIPSIINDSFYAFQNTDEINIYPRVFKKTTKF